jgi:hypothetical protein
MRDRLAVAPRRVATRDDPIDSARTHEETPAMSLKRQAARQALLKGPAAKLAPRRRTPLERLVGAIELWAVARAASRVTARKRSRVPSARVLALVGGGVLAVVVAAWIVRRRSRDSAPQPASEAPATVTGRPNGDMPGQVAVADPSAATVAATGTLGGTAGGPPPGADPEGEEKLDVDAPNEGATGDQPPAQDR